MRVYKCLPKHLFTIRSQPTTQADMMMNKFTVFLPLLFLNVVIPSIHGKDITASLKHIIANGASSATAAKAEASPGTTQIVSSNTDDVAQQRSGLSFGSNFWDPNWFDSSFGSFGYTTLHSTINCSEANNPSTAFTIGVVGTGYPALAIGVELNSRPLFSQFLVQEVPGPIVVPADAVFDSANRTCPGVAFNVWSFNSATRGACWVLQGFQDPLFTVVCQAGDCVGCSSHSSTSSHVGTSTIFKNRCIPQYKSISVWAYCPLAGSPAILREQVIVPSFCSCVKTPCTVTTSSSGW